MMLRHPLIAPLLRLGLGVLSLALLAPAPARAEYVVITGETWHGVDFGGVILLPSGTVFDIEAEQLALITTDVPNDETLIFDLAAGTAQLESETPSELLANDPFLMGFAREIEVQTLAPGGIVFESGPSAATVDALGAVTWLGVITAPPGAGGGGGGGTPPPTDSDGDGVPNSSDNCDTVPNPTQTNTDGDSMGDACDPDDDNDGILDVSDNCRTTPNADQTNTDGDAFGDACDPDDDNDGLSDVLEIGTYGTDPLDPDSDGDGYSDFEEVNAGTDPNDENSHPAAPVPVLGAIGSSLLSGALAGLGLVRSRRRRRSTGA
jgi:hypothetical protein